MSIYSQLETMQIRERELLNRAMGLLAQVENHPHTEDYFRKRISELEKEVIDFKKGDPRLLNTCVAFDLNEYPKSR
jgi:hypothetical protein